MVLRSPPIPFQSAAGARGQPFAATLLRHSSITAAPAPIATIAITPPIRLLVDVLVGVAAGVGDTANRNVAALQRRIATVEAKVQTVTTRPSVYYELDSTYYTVGHGSYMDTLITMAGGVNVAGSIQNPYPQLSAEKLLVDNPQFVILGDAAYGVSPASVGKRPGWSGIAAVKAHHVVAFNDDLASRPGPRIVDGLEQLTHILHPELYR